MSDSKAKPETAGDFGSSDCCPTIHELKTWPEYFAEVLAGTETFEIRKNDRNFKVGDILALHEWCPSQEQYMKECVIVEVMYIRDFGQPETQVVMAIRKSDNV